MSRIPARLPPAAPPANSQSRWFVVRLKDHGFGGPLSIEGIRNSIEAGTLAWTDIAYVEGTLVGGWKRLFEIEGLKVHLPGLPEPGRLEKFTERAASAPKPVATAARGDSGWFDYLNAASMKIPRVEWSSPRYWYLLLDGREVGPVDLTHIEQVSRLAKIPESVYGWHVSMRRWKPLADIPELSKYVGKASTGHSSPELSLVIERGTQKRRSTRRSIVAAVFAMRSSGASEMIGICGDVSPEGFQLLQHGQTVDYITGTQMKIEIRSSKTSQISPFRATAVVKWFDPVKKIAGFEFVTLDPADRKLLQKFSGTL